MNHTYRLVWNEGAQRHVPAAEVGRSRGKSRSGKVLVRCSVFLAAVLCAVHGSRSLAAPTGGTVVAGQGTISQTGNTTTVQQQTQNLSLDWTSFSIAPSQTVQFVQPSSTAIALNRVVGNEPSQIYGNLLANGQVFLINTNGVLFGKSAQVNVGSLVASSLNITDADFLSGNYRFQGTTAGATPASVINQGVINASAGSSIALLGGQVSNQGVITAQLGTVALAAGSAMTLEFSGSRLLSVQVDQGAADALAENRQLIQADGGKVIMTAAARDALLNTVVNNTGVIEARTIQNQGGEISLLGGANGGTVNVEGTLDASAPNGGNGGTIETSGAHVQVADSAHISTAAAAGKTGTWLVDPTDFTIAPSGGDISGTTLSSELATTNVVLASTSGTVSGNGDIFVNDVVNWSANTTLTLNAVRNIVFNSSMAATGDGAGLSLIFGGSYSLNNGSSITLSGASPSLSINGQSYTVINSLGVAGDTSGTTLQGMNGAPSGYYALGSDINASASGGFSTGGFTPIGNSSSPFTGTLAGLGHVITDLTVDPNVSVAGLFGYAGTGSLIRDVGIDGVTVASAGQSYVGALVGENFGSIGNTYATNVVVSGASAVGGLVGRNFASITNSFTSGTVSATGSQVGGLVGLNDGSILNDYSTASVSGTYGVTGGLVGDNWGTVYQSHANGSVTGANLLVGGLVGDNEQGSSILNSYATGAVTSQSQMFGGLAGENSGAISGSYATGNVTATATGGGSGYVGGLVGFNGAGGTISTSYYLNTAGRVNGGGLDDIGGLVGYNSGSVDQSYATANVTGTNSVGGLVGYAANVSGAAVTQSYATGSVAGTGSGIGGLIGTNFQNITDSYTAATVSGSGSNIGGFIGSVSGGTVTSSYWIASGSTTDTSGAIQLTTAQAEQESSYAGWNFSGVWRIYNGHTAPLLETFLTPLTITDTNAFTTYDGVAFDYTLTQLGTPTYSVPGAATSSHLYGASTAYYGDRNAGTYAPNLWSDQQGYDITLVGGNLYVAKAPLVISTSNVVKIYDGTTSAIGSPIAVNSTYVWGTDTLSGGTFAFTDPNAGSNKTVTVSAVTVNDGNGGNNYSVTYVNNTASTINKASLTLTAGSSTKTYDGTTASTGTVTETGAVTGQTVSATESYASKNVLGTNGSTLQVNSGYTITDASGADMSGNYTVATATAAGTISPAALTLAAGSATKTYDGTTSSTGTVTETGAVTGDSVSATESYGSKNVLGTNGSTLQVNSGYTIIDASGADMSGNYTITTATAAGTIAPASLTITSSNVVKTYDGTTSAAGSALVAGGTQLFSTDSISGGTFAFTDPNAGSNKSVTVSAVTVSDGNGGNNYSVTYIDNTTSTINKASLTLAASSATKTYDGTTSSTGTVTETGAVTGDSVSANESYASKNVLGTGASTLQVNSGYTITNASGADMSGNYTIATTTAAGTITPAALTLAANGSTKTYDGTTTSTGTVTETGAVTGDSVSATESYASKNVLGTNGSTLLVNSGYTITDASGADMSGNYTIATATAAGTINKAALTLAAASATKTYDGTTFSTGTVTETGAVTGDSVSAIESYASKNVLGTGGSTLQVSGYTITDASGANMSGNYAITTTAATGTITPAALTLAAGSATKTYDGTTSSTGPVTETGAATGDTVNATESYASKNALGTNGSTLQVNNNYTITDASGADMSGNYTIATATATGTINKAALTLAAGSSTKTYDGTTASTGTVAETGAVTGDSVSATESYASKNVLGTNGSTLQVNSGYTITDTSGADMSGNYTIATASAAGTITPAALTLTSGNVVKTYDGTTSAAGNALVTGGTQLFSTDTISGGTFAFTDPNAGSNKSVTVGAVTVSDGNGGNNYSVTYVDNATSTINKAALTLAATSSIKTYDGTIASTGAVAETGAVTGDSVSATESYASKNVLGTGGSTLQVNSGYTITNASGTNMSGNYTIATTNAAGTITPAALILAASSSTKTYDGTTSSTGTVTETGAVTGDSVSAIESYASKNVLGSGASTLQVNSGYTITDASGASMSGNYTITTTAASGTITPAALTLAATSGTKTYDGTTASTGTITETGAVTGDSVSATESYASKNVLGTGGSTLLVNSGYTVTDASGADMSSNYTIATASAAGTITPASLAITSGSVVKTYDGTTSAAGNALVTGGTQLFSTDTISGGTFAFTDPNAASNKSVAVSGVTISDGNGGNNYSVTYVDNTTSTINKAALTLAATTSTKTYDGTTASTGTVAETGAVTGDSVSATESYASKNVLGAAGSTLLVNNNYSITDAAGADMSGNYTVATAAAAGTINPAVLTVSGATAANKVYDGGVAATVSGGSVGGVIGSDAVSLTEAGYFSDKNAGTNKSVQEVFGLTGNDAQDYILASNTAQTTANITPKTLTVSSGITANNKTYDGTASATLNTSGASLTGEVTGDSLGVSAVGTFVDLNAGTNRAVTLSNLTLTGTDSGNYVLAASGNESSTTANITPAALTVTANNATKVAGAANPALAVTYSGFASGESASSLTSEATASTTASTTSSAGTYAITASGADDPNYTINYVAGTLTVTSSPATAVTSSSAYVGALSSVTQPQSSLNLTDPTAGDSVDLKGRSDDSEIYDGMLDIDTPKRVTEALPILALIVLDKGIRLPDGVQ